MPEPFVLRGALLSPRSREQCDYHADAAMVVDEGGRIVFRGPFSELPMGYTALPVRDAGGVILPGFVDTHVHVPQFDCRGMHGADLLAWLRDFIFPEEQRFAVAEVARDVAGRFFAAMHAAGTRTAMVYASSHEQSTHIAFEEAERSGLRILMGAVMMDRNAPPALCVPVGEAERAARRLIERWHRATPRLHYVITPRFGPTCSEELLRMAGGLAREFDLHVQTHINESCEEIGWVRELFPESASYTDVYDRASLLGERTVLGHDVHVDDAQLAMIAARGCAVAHCPDSNAFLGSGRFPLQRHREHGMRIGLGSDVGAGTTLDMRHIANAMATVQLRSMHPFEKLYMATLAGAEALGLADRTGSLDVGKDADYCVVDIGAHFPEGKLLEDLSAVEVASVVLRPQPHGIRHEV
jgi:guanine deaminase